MQSSIKGKMVNNLAEYSGSAAGAVLGAEIGTVVAGPVGAAGGALIGTAVEKLFVWAGAEIKNRYLSTSENKKVGYVYDEAKNKISQKLDAGIPLRTDDFFRSKVEDRSSAEEIFEGTLFAAQRECEEKKLTYIANLYANISFNVNISRPMANQLLKIASTISYRQLVILSIVGKCNSGVIHLQLRDTAFRGFENYDDMSIATDIFDLYRMSLIISKTAILDAASFTPSHLVVNGVGELLFTLMELSDMPNDELSQSIINFLTNDSPAPEGDAVVTAELPQPEMHNFIELIDEKLADVPRFEIETEENSAGGETVLIRDKRYVNEQEIVSALKEV